MITLKHGDTVRLASWTRFPYETATARVGTARGYAIESNLDPVEMVERAVKNGHELAWTTYIGSILVDDRAIAERMKAERDAEFARAVTLAEGDTVTIEGMVYRVKAARMSVDGPRNSDPIKFMP
jgi:hypothetical protein